MEHEMTLAIDCGGGGIKGSVVDERGTMMAPARRVPTPYPLPPELLVETVVGLAKQLPAPTRVTMGMPGMIRHGGHSCGYSPCLCPPAPPLHHP